jgi:hypothetical protein
MNTIGVVGVLAIFLIISPAICDEGHKSVKEIVTQNPQPYLNSFGNEFPSGNAWFERSLRAPSGFMGVRGKKEYDDGDDDEAIDWNVEVFLRFLIKISNFLTVLSCRRQNDLYYPYFPKRAPSGFVGMRGKKAPSGFVGMRGKKFNYEYEPSFSDDFQAQLFHELQKEREMLVNLIDEYNNNNNYANDMEKRRPEGFVGLRGKKSVSNSDYFIDEKRIPMGFAGVRGKRVPIASFFGMRGKKEPVSKIISTFLPCFMP